MLLFLLGVFISVVIYTKLIKPCYYWRNKGIKHAKSWPAVGSMGKVFFKKQPFVDVALNLYRGNPEERYVGYMQFMQQNLLLRDIDLIKQITVKEFNHFTDHVIFGQGCDADPILSKCLVSLNGEKWKNMRVTLNPVFTSSNIKNTYLLMEECVESFLDNLDGEVELEMLETFSKIACDVIASAAFGVKTNCLKEPNDFFKMGVRLSDFTSWQTIKLIFSQTFPKLTQIFRLQIFPKRVTAFFRSIIQDNIEKRENEGIVRPDLIHLLLQARKGQLKSEINEKIEGFAVAEDSDLDPNTQSVELTNEHITAQAIMFLLAGFDTVARTCSFMAHELAVNQDVQKKLQQEIDGVKKKYFNKIPYDALLGMKYLDQVVSETLRLWPPGFEIDRLCVRDYVILPKYPEEKSFHVQKGIDVIIPVMAIHRDPQYFPEPDRFDPERFNDKNKSNITPGTYLPFGLGPRNCIGSRFALLEIKTVFCHLLTKFDIVPIAKTEIPIKISKTHFNLQPEKGFWLGFKPRKL